MANTPYTIMRLWSFVGAAPDNYIGAAHLDVAALLLYWAVMLLFKGLDLTTTRYV